MFETISNNYCLGGDTSSKSLKNKMDPHRYVLPRGDRVRSGKRQLSRDQDPYGTNERRSRADLYYNKPAQGRNTDNNL